MHKITIRPPQNDSLVSQLFCLYNSFKGVPFDEARDFDISNIDWFYPLLILPISAHINCFGSQFSKDRDKPSQKYLEVVSFPTGIDSVSVFEQQLQFDKSFIPISTLKKDKGADRERLESLFSTMIYKILGSVPDAQNAVYYPITEIVTNIFDHSKKDVGFIFGQFYPKKNYLDVCIVDCGKGLAKGYEDEKSLKLSDSDAILEVLKGNSTKPSIERGYGVRTSKRVVCEGLGGEFILLSGSSVLIASGKEQKIVALPGFCWQGVIVAYRIPKPAGAVDISPFLE